MYNVSTQGVDERMINGHYYYYCRTAVLFPHEGNDLQSVYELISCRASFRALLFFSL